MLDSHRESAAVALLVRWAGNNQGEVKRIGYRTRPVWSHLIPEESSQPRDDKYDICESIVLRGSKEDISIAVHYFGYLHRAIKRKQDLPGLVNKVMRAGTTFSPTTARIKAKAETIVHRVSEEAFSIVTRQGQAFEKDQKTSRP